MKTNLQILLGQVQNHSTLVTRDGCFKRTSAMDYGQQGFFASTSHRHWHDIALMEGVTLGSLQMQSSKCRVDEMIPKGSHERHRIMPHRANADSDTTYVGFQNSKSYLTQRAQRFNEQITWTSLFA